jgi:hypothetical protein
VYPTGQSSPVAAIAVESPQGALASGAGVIAAGTGGSVDVYATNSTDLVIDVNGYYAPISDSSANTALGVGALAANTTGFDNTASGVQALYSNTTGRGNTASGSGALQANTTGNDNTAIGFAALPFNTASDNTAIGSAAMDQNTTGANNTASGSGALNLNTIGSNNTASGVSALKNNTTGSNNIAIGINAAANVSSSDSNNIHIGNVGLAADNGTIRIGTPVTQTSFFAAGVRGVTTGNNDAIPVMIDSAGQLGTVSSSRRFKEDIADMGTASSGLMRLRPVTFRYQKPFADGSKPTQYGLIAEEVAEVYPDLVARSADGQIETVKYQVLDSLLLNELQKEHRQVQEQAETIRLLETRLAALEKALLAGK